MRLKKLWEQAGELKIQTSPTIVGNFDIGFDDRIPEGMKDELMRFVYWVEDHYHMPITLWVDFKYNHYLLNRDKKRVGFLFYWSDFTTYPVFENEDDLPVIELPVRTGFWTMEEILSSFIEAISYYFAWLTGQLDADFKPDEQGVEEILQDYLSYCPYMHDSVDEGLCYDLQMIALGHIREEALPNVEIRKPEILQCCAGCRHAI